MARTLRISLIQIDVRIGLPDDNFAAVAERLEEAVRQSPRPDVLVLPEMWNTGYALERIRELADPGGRRTRAMVSEFCRRHRVNVIAGSVAELRESGGVTNTAHGFDRDGTEIVEYSKIHRFRLMDEHLHLEAGERPGLFRLEGTEAGVQICYDIRFPELSRRLALDGARVLFVPAEWPHPRLHHWRTLLQARAIENQLYVVACNRVGVSGGTSFFGHSMIVDPWGEIVAEGGEGEEIVTAGIDLDAVDEVRGRIPVFEDRRPRLY